LALENYLSGYFSTAQFINQFRFIPDINEQSTNFIVSSSLGSYPEKFEKDKDRIVDFDIILSNIYEYCLAYGSDLTERLNIVFPLLT
jgi:hypothetical protein